jgi:hypothetical protein
MVVAASTQLVYSQSSIRPNSTVLRTCHDSLKANVLSLPLQEVSDDPRISPSLVRCPQAVPTHFASHQTTQLAITKATKVNMICSMLKILIISAIVAP